MARKQGAEELLATLPPADSRDYVVNLKGWKIEATLNKAKKELLGGVHCCYSDRATAQPLQPLRDYLAGAESERKT